MTKGRWRPAWRVAAALLFAPGAHAAVATSIDLTNLRVSVAALAPGAAPAVSFAGAGGSTSECDVSSGMPPATWVVSSASDRAFGQAASATPGDLLGGGAAMLSGDVFGAGGSVHTSAFADSTGPDVTGQGTVGLGDGLSAEAFTLAPWTRLAITADVRATASVTGASPFEYANSGLSLSLSDDDGLGPQFVRFTLDAFAWGQFGAVDDVESTAVHLVYENDTDRAVSGLFSGYVASIAYSGNPLSAVPEPDAAAMLGAALSLAAAAARARRGERPAP